MYTTLICAALVFADDKPARPGAAPDRPAAMNASLDGNWTVVALEKNGRPVPEAKSMTVSVKGNVVTFNTARATGNTGAAGDRSQMRAMRLHFGPNGTLHVTEANEQGKFENARSPAGDNDKAVKPGEPAIPTGSKAGVYILTRDHLAVCIHEEGGRPSPTAGTDRPEGGVRPAGGTDRPAAGAVGSQPQTRSYCTVILKRAEGGTRPGAGDRPNSNPDK